MKRPLLLGHRGARHYAPENSYEAFELALNHGCDGFEFDVRYTSEGTAVLCHDAFAYGLELKRTDYEQLAGAFGQAVRSSLQMATRKRPFLPCLEDVIAEYSRRAYLDIELKVMGELGPLLAMLAEFPPQKGYVVSSFDPEILTTLHTLDATVPLGLICESERQFREWERLPVAALMLHKKMAQPERLDLLRHAGKQLFVWTVNEEARVRELLSLGVDGIISDDTAMLVRTSRQ